MDIVSCVASIASRRARRAFVAALALAVTPLSATAAPTARPSSPSPGVGPASPRGMVSAGKAQVSIECSPEFISLQSQISFYERPYQVCARWGGKSPALVAHWELYQQNGTTRDIIASGAIDASTLALADSSFAVNLQSHLPQWNTGTTDQVYYVAIFAKSNESSKRVIQSTPAKLIHKPQSGKPTQGKADPYTCPNGEGATRKVTVGVTKMTVNHTTTLGADGDRDEVYFSIGRKGPGLATKQSRMPSQDDYYEAPNGTNVESGHWTNKDGNHMSNPRLWSGNLAHGEIVTLAITAGEQDNADLDDIKKGIQDAMKVIATLGAQLGSYGAIAAAVAGAVAAGASFIPETTGDDTIGFIAVRLTNKCGYIQTAWVTFPSASTSEGTIKNDIEDPHEQETFESRVVVASNNPPGFNLDFGDFVYVGASDAFWWDAQGTHGSQYTFTMFETVTNP